MAPRVAFSDIRFLKRAPVMQRRRRRLRELLLLSLRIAALALLVLAFARPFFDESGLLERSATVVLLDSSFSMGAPGVFERARAAATSALADAPSDYAVGLVVFDHRAEVAHELSMNRGAVTAAVQLVDAGVGSTGFALGLGAAAELLGARTGRIVVVTDLQRSGWDGVDEVAVPADIEVEVVAVDAGSMNLAVTEVQVGPAGLAAVVVNGGPRAVDDDIGPGWRRAPCLHRDADTVRLD